MCDVPCSKTGTHNNLLHQFANELKPINSFFRCFCSFCFLIPVFGSKDAILFGSVGGPVDKQHERLGLVIAIVVSKVQLRMES